jgi:formate dehydrogenase subunit gamma
MDHSPTIPATPNQPPEPRLIESNCLVSNTQTWDAPRALARIRELDQIPGALLPILHALQDEFGYIHDEAVPLIADALNISHAEVHGVITFYHDFRRTPPGRHALHVCRAESCQSMGCDKLIEHIEGRLGVKLGSTTPDEVFTVSQVFCLGNCALSPALMLDGRPYGRVTTGMADSLIDDIRRRAQ